MWQHEVKLKLGTSFYVVLGYKRRSDIKEVGIKEFKVYYILIE